MKIFSIDGKLKNEVVFFKRHSPLKKSGNVYDFAGNILVLGTYLDFELKKRRLTEIIEIT